MAKRIYKVFANLALRKRVMVRYLTLLDTVAGPNFVVESVLPPQLQARVNTNAITDILDANNNPMKTVGTINRVVNLGYWWPIWTFYFASL